MADGVNKNLLERKFVTVSDDGSEPVRIMQWNVLAQGFTGNDPVPSGLSGGDDNFTSCPKEALEWDYRKGKLIEEITRYAPAILCAEEVDMFEYLIEQLSPLGYMGIFKPKPDSICLQKPNNMGPDGCALFYNTHKVRLSESDSIILKIETKPQNQVALIGNFTTNSDNPKSFTVALTHLKAKRGNDAIRAGQVKYLIEHLKLKHSSGPLIVCGDFNAEPTEESCQKMKQDLQMTSTYTLLSKDGSEPKFTTWKLRPGLEDCHVIDYIWYSKGIKVKAILDVPSDEEVGENRLPSLRYPSDHISLVADVLFE